MGTPGTVIVGGVDAHRSSRDAVLAEGNSSGETLLFEFAVTKIPEEFVRLCVVCNENVRPRIAIGIEHCNAEGLGGRVGDTGARAHVFKFTSA